MPRSIAFLPLLALLSLVVLAGCATDPAKLQQVSQEEAGRMTPPAEPLSRFARFTLAPMVLAPDVQADSAKVAKSRELEDKLAARLGPLLDEWNAKPSRSGRSLVITPTVQQLRIVSGAARFWIGAMAGESIVDIRLALDEERGRSIGEARVVRGSGGMVGGWSVGATDRNLLDYIAEISHAYLAGSY